MKYGIGLLFSLLLFLACEKEEDLYITSSENLIICNNSLAELSRLALMVHKAGADTNLIKNAQYLPDCTQLNLTTTDTTRTVSFNFGVDGCISKSQYLLKGTISFRRMGSSNYELSFDQFHVNNSKIIGTFSFSFSGNTFEVEGDEVRLINPNGTISWDLTRVITVSAENNSETLTDQLFSVKGKSTGTDYKSKTFSETISTALTFDFNCQYVYAGSHEMTISSISNLQNLIYTETCSSQVNLKAKEGSAILQQK